MINNQEYLTGDRTAMLAKHDAQETRWAIIDMNLAVMVAYRRTYLAAWGTDSDSRKFKNPDGASHIKP